MIIDEKGRLFGKFNILDIVVVLAILVVIAGVGYKFLKSNTPTPFRQADRIETSFFVEEVPDYAAAAIKAGDTVTDRVTGSAFGKVVSVDVQPSVSYAPDQEGHFVRTSKETYRSVRIVVQGEGIWSEKGVTFGNIDYYINKQQEYRFGNVAFFCRIQNMQVVK